MSECEHAKRKSRCKHCRGSEICEHNRIKSCCKDCNGSEICEHNRRKSCCKECRGSQICEHNSIKSTCKKCNGASICEHKSRKSYCKECRGSQICEHNRQKAQCKDCCGISICEHGRIKSRCKDCCGISICEHNRIKSSCKDCRGASICEHGKHKSYCKYCGGSQLCKTPLCETYKNRKYEGYCLNCFIHIFPDKPNVRNYKTKEKDVVDRITNSFHNFTWVADKTVQDGCSRRRPDLLLDVGSHIIIVEVDENKHTDYDCSCEHKRLMELSQDLQHRPIVFIRFNPDEYVNQEGVMLRSCWKLNKLGVIQVAKTKQKEWEERIEILKQQIQYWMDNPTEKTIEIIELFY